MSFILLLTTSTSPKIPSNIHCRCSLVEIYLSDARKHCDVLAPTSSCAAPLHPSDHLIHVRHPFHSLSTTSLTFPTTSSPFHPSRSCPSHRHEQHRSTAPHVLQRGQVFESVFVCLVLIALVVPKQCAIALYKPIHSSPSLHSTTHFTFIIPINAQRILHPHSSTTSPDIPTLSSQCLTLLF